MNKTIIIALLVLVTLLAGCSQSKEYQPGAPAPPLQSEKKTAVSVQDEQAREMDKQKAGEGREEAGGRMIVYTVELSLEVKDVDAAFKTLDAMVKESKGYLVSSSVSRGDEKYRTARMAVRVPSGSLTPFVDKVSQVGEMLSQQKTGQDVTEEYVDSSARFTNMKLEEAKYQEMFKAAQSVDDMLKVRRELGRVRGDIEALEGRLKFLKSSADMATVNISLTQSRIEAPRSFWNFGKTAESAFTTLKYLVKFLADVVIFLVILIPFFVLALLFFRGLGILRGVLFPKKKKPDSSEQSKE
ncbi:MAG: DUF4349 domain-containing protein [Candidatus Eremiobacteraeota bacterium]|nr:DUF4349 domain-containing protein [Candidatus Eremiobacteraeota bacterium]